MRKPSFGCCVTALLILFYSIEAKSADSRYPCEPAAEISKTLEKLDLVKVDATISKKERWNQQEKILLSLLKKYPDDIFLHRAYQEYYRYQWFTDMDPLVDRYRKMEESHPQDPIYLYLFGHVLSRANNETEAIKYLQKAVEIAPEIPQIHITLAAHYSMRSYENQEHLKEQVDSLLKSCPNSSYAYTYASELSDKMFNRNMVNRLRSLVGHRTDLNAAQLYSALWKMDFKAEDPAKHHEVRNKIASDLQRLKQKVSGLIWLHTLEDGYNYIQDEKGIRWVEDRILHDFPKSEDAAEITSDRWQGEPSSEWLETSFEEMKTTARDLYHKSGEWMTKWPYNNTVLLNRWGALQEVDNVPSSQIEQDCMDLLRRWEENGSKGLTNPSFYFGMASIFVKKGIRLDLVPELVDKGIKEDEETLARRLSWSADMELKKESERSFQRSEYRYWNLLSDYWIKMKDPVKAKEMLQKMESYLQTQRSLEDNESRRTLLVLQTDYWRRMAELTFAEGRKLDALTYYRNAIATKSNKEVEQQIQKLWNELGGTAEALSVWNVPVQQKADLADPLWEEVNKPVPDFHFTDLNGKKWQLADLKGKVTVINVWATWCSPCQYELPYFQKLFDRLKSDPNALILTFDEDDDIGDVESYMTKHAYTFPVLLARSFVDQIRPNSGVPQMWILDSDGVIRWYVEGFNPEGADSWIDQVISRIEKTSGYVASKSN